jgi:4-amino-4-deoxy-L-arabinose transferase-like glycosyltransferase
LAGENSALDAAAEGDYITPTINIGTVPVRMRRDFIAPWKQIAGRKGLIILLSVALMVRLLYLFVMVGEVTGSQLLGLAPDTVRYVQIGQAISGNGPGDEDALVVFGPGYGFFLGLVFLLCGVSPYPILILQIIISSLGCLLLYKLGRELTDSKAAGLIAGYLSAFSFTSVSLANYILSDCLFFFLFLLGNVLFLLGLRHNRIWWHVGAGVSVGAAILVRSIGQFWPVVMLALVFVLPPHTRGRSWLAGRLAVLKKAYIAPLIALVIMGGWMTRNYVRYGVPFLAFTGAGGPARLALAAISQAENREQGEIRDAWLDDYKQAHGLDSLTWGDEYRAYTEAVRGTVQRYLWAMLDEYRKLIWENIGAMNELYHSQIPLHKDEIAEVMNRMKGYGLHYAAFCLGLVSGMIMLWRRRWRLLIFLGMVYVYFALMVGFTRWQGSRLFYPGQIAWSVAIGFLVIAIGDLVMDLLRRRQTVRTGKKIDSAG